MIVANTDVEVFPCDGAVTDVAGVHVDGLRRLGKTWRAFGRGGCRIEGGE